MPVLYETRQPKLNIKLIISGTFNRYSIFPAESRYSIISPNVRPLFHYSTFKISFILFSIIPLHHPNIIKTISEQQKRPKLVMPYMIPPIKALYQTVLSTTTKNHQQTADCCTEIPDNKCPLNFKCFLNLLKKKKKNVHFEAIVNSAPNKGLLLGSKNR